MSRDSEDSQNLLLLFGSRATDEATAESDHDLLRIVHVKPERKIQELPASISGLKRISLDELPYNIVKEGLIIGAPDILIIFTQCQVLEGHDIFQKLLWLDQGITSLSVSLSLKKAQKTINFCEELLYDKFGRLAAHQLSVAWFWVLATARFAVGMIPRSKKQLFHLGEEEFTISERKMLEYSSYASADLYEPPHEEVREYLFKVKENLRVVIKTTYENYLSKANKFLKKTHDLFSRGDYDLTILAAHATIELVVKGFLLKKVQKAPLYQLQALEEKELHAALEESLTKHHFNELREINKKRNQIYHTTYFANEEDAKRAITLAKTLLNNLSS